MTETADQIFVLLKHWLVAFAPAGWQPFFSMLISAAAIVGGYAGLFALTIVLDRQRVGRVQYLYGPVRVRSFGVLQPLADGVKSLSTADIVPRSADQVVHFIGPLRWVGPVVWALAVSPKGRNLVAADL